jgi:hypothetical protein
MFSSNPFAELSTLISPTVMQTYVVVMILLVAAGTLFDIVHKKSAKYFFQNWRKSKSQGTDVGAAEMVSIAVKTAAIDAITSGEFCNQSRRVAHLLTMYGFVLYAAATAVMTFGFPTAATATPAIWPQLWHIGALMVCAGGYWFWFFIRVDVLAEGHSRFRIIRADLFILSLVISVTLGLVWSYLQASGNGAATIVLGAYIVATTMLFGSVPWSKFSHMFYKPAAAFEKRVSDANGTRSNLPAPTNNPETFGKTLQQQQSNHY